MPVELIDVGAEVDTPTEEPLDGGPSEAAAVADEELTLVAADVWSVDVLLVDVLLVDVLLVDVLSVDDFAGGSLTDEPESVSAHATPGAVATAIPTPNAAANPPTRPMHLALPMIIPPSHQLRMRGCDLCADHALLLSAQVCAGQWQSSIWHPMHTRAKGASVFVNLLGFCEA